MRILYFVEILSALIAITTQSVVKTNTETAPTRGSKKSTVPRSVLNLNRIDLNCPVECGCKRGYINCTSRGLGFVPRKNRKTNYTASLPHAMWLNDNAFGSVVAASNFSDWTMLKTLSLRNCSVRRVMPRTFAHMRRLAILDLSANSGGIVIDDFAFTGTRLEALLLDQNPGISISKRAFENATIRSLRLRRCKLTTLDPEVLLPLSSSIESLVISENSITSLSDKFEPLFDSISFFDVTKNPWVCDCSVAWLVQVYEKRLNRTRLLNPIEGWASGSMGHGLPVPKCQAPRQQAGVNIENLQFDSSELVCTPAAIIGIDVDQARGNETRFRCSASGNPVALVHWHFPRVEDEYDWAFSIVENKTTLISPNAFSAPGPSSGVVLVSEAFLTIRNRPPISKATPGSASNQVRLICKAINTLGAASLMTNFDVTERNSDGKKTVPLLYPEFSTQRPRTAKPSSTTPYYHNFLSKSRSTVPVFSKPIKQLAVTTTAIVLNSSGLSTAGYGYAATSQSGETVVKVENSTGPSFQEGNLGMAQQVISQGLLVTVAVLVAIIMSSLGGCCLVIACSTSKVPNCPNVKRAPSRYPASAPSRQSVGRTTPKKVVMKQAGSDVVQDGTQDRRPLLKPRYDGGGGGTSHSSTHGSSKPKSRHRDQKPSGHRRHSQHSTVVNEISSPVPTSSSSGVTHSNTLPPPFTPPQTFSTFRSAIDIKPVIPPKPLEISQVEILDTSKRRYNSYYGRHRHGTNSLGLFLSPPPPAPRPDIDAIEMGKLGGSQEVLASTRSASSFPEDISKHNRCLSNSSQQSEMCSDKDKKGGSSGYRSLVGIGSDGCQDDVLSGGTRSSEPCDAQAGGFSPTAGDVGDKSRAPVADADEITFL